MEETEEIKRYLKFQRKLRAIRLAEDLGYKCACEVFKMSKTTFFNWKKKYDTFGEEGLRSSSSVVNKNSRP
jgi:putative transposase